ncbi:MAG: hypothetical protein ACXWJK_12835 [Burkholderiaceae bacterium]
MSEKFISWQRKFLTFIGEQFVFGETRDLEVQDDLYASKPDRNQIDLSIEDWKQKYKRIVIDRLRRFSIVEIAPLAIVLNIAVFLIVTPFYLWSASQSLKSTPQEQFQRNSWGVK